MQAVYLEHQAACALAISGTCTQFDLDDCRRAAESQCQPAAALDRVRERYCTRWLECNASPVDRYLQRCKDELAARPDAAFDRCLSAAAAARFVECVEAASCAQLDTWPLLQLCAAVYE
ncbi:MAG: hypothetical protein JXR96_26770 [Deltaproteobacteria bacterium]|nr:hypothetical protein [Deltaproteobacteria bacterium]